MLSDLHVYQPSSTSGDPSRISTTGAEDSPTTHPIVGLRDLIKRQVLKADILVCCGDMCDRADPAGVRHAWERLESLRTEFGADMLIGTAGNHDIDSRHKHNDHDAKGHLQDLIPLFPVKGQIDADKYWARHYCILEINPEFRILVLNSSAYHGATGANGDPPEYLHGRVSERTIMKIIADLNGRSKKSVNMLICHHHPARNNQIKEADYSEMDGGDKLINALAHQCDAGPWLIAHGHKHYPNLVYAAGGAAPPIIFSLGSFSAKLYSELASRTRNQFYILELELHSIGSTSSALCGTVRAWDWYDLKGWVAASNDAEIPDHAGFGYRGNVDYFASQIAAFVMEKSAYVDLADLISQFPDWKYVLPIDKKRILKVLREKHAIKVLVDSENLLPNLQLAK
ncbi:metallophosphoesterase family protein [Ferrovibrio sp.]|uniref:metallophosphoesterase family protein n=1 Tax=Ferrovibrio sp. TaxID=1917215 RepID=UPI003D0B2ABB